MTVRQDPHLSSRADSDPAPGGDRRTRRRFTRRQWRRRWRAGRPVVLLVVVLGVVAGAVWAVYFSHYLAVTGVRVEGAGLLDPAEVRRTAGVPLGGPLATADLAAIDARVEAMAPVLAADVSRRWPDQVLVSLTERTPVAVVEIAGQTRGMDAHGVVFREYLRPPRGLPLVRTSAGTPADALREAAGVIAALPPPLARRVAHIEVATVDQITLALRDGRLVRWGSAEESPQKARVLAALLARQARIYNVSVPGQPTTVG